MQVILKKIFVLNFYRFNFFKNFFLVAVIGLTLFTAQWVAAVQIDQDQATTVAQNFISYLRSSRTIDDSKTMKQSGRTVGYLMRLSPRGYILVAGNTIRVPIKAYSFSSNYEDLPPGYTQSLLGDLKISETRSPQTMRSTRAEASQEEPNQNYWIFLTNYGDQRLLKSSLTTSYAPNTYLLPSRWNQAYPYNKFNPELNNALTVTGCVPTALAQVMRYHAHPYAGSGVFTHIWNGQVLTAVMNRPFNWNVMPDSVDGSVESYQQEEVAALMRDLGILNEADFGIEETSAYFHHEMFERAFNYAPILTMASDHADFFSTIMDEINQQRPVLLILPGHLAVADGYASDGSGRKIHVNLGWGGAYDDYYFLDETIQAGSNTYEPDHEIYYNIRPCENDECDPYPSESSGSPPVIASNLPDIILSTPTTIRIEAYDPDGDTVALSATSSCTQVTSNLTENLLTLTAESPDIFCTITVTAQSDDGRTEKTFKLLVLEDSLYMGTEYDINGVFINKTGIDEYNAYLEGELSLSGDRGFSNQAFYLWVKDQNDNIVIPASDTPISGNLSAGFYTICASLKNPFTNYYYNFDADNSGYILSVTSTELTWNVTDVADSLGINLTTANPGNEQQDFIVLTEMAPDTTIFSGDSVVLYGNKEVNHITLESAAKVNILHCPGSNIITMPLASYMFSVSHSGATVLFEASDGTVLKISATITPQTIIFTDKSLSLVIDADAGHVLLGNQIINR